jgi:hypothetical protein
MKKRRSFMARKITVSFKETTKDIELYSYLVSLEDKSTEIKNLIKLGIQAKNNKEGKSNE